MHREAISRFPFWLLAGLTLVLAAACSSSPSEPSSNEEPEGFRPGWIYSPQVHDSMRVYLHTPMGFTAQDAPTTHLVVLLDADWYMNGNPLRLGDGGVVGIAQRLAETGTIPEPVILGIGEINQAAVNMRGRDFLTAPEGLMGFLSQTLLPRFLEEYAPPGEGFRDITLMGHSDGAYFALWALFRDGPVLFRNVVGISGDFTKTHVDLYAMEAAYYARGAGASTCLFLGVGGLEEERFLNSFQEMVHVIQGREDQRLTLSSKNYAGLDHGTVVGPAFTEGLAFALSGECSG